MRFKTKSSRRKTYNVLYADPPWKYRDTCDAGKRGAAHKYDLMNLQDIEQLPIQKIVAQDCACFMWATAPLMHEALHVMAAWGFIYKTVAFTWVKRTKHWKLVWGMGSYTRANCEFVLLGIRGKLTRQSKGVHQVVEARVREHSQKPEEVRNKIVELYGDVPRVELFSRDQVPGWDMWGNQTETDLPLDPELW